MRALHRLLMPTGLIFFAIGLYLCQTGTLRAQGTSEERPILDKLIASTGVASDGFGAEIAVSGDILVVGTPNAAVDGKLFAGAAYVFVRDPASGGWVERKRLVAQDGAAFDQFASSVAIDGDTAVLGGVLLQGAAYVFERHAGGVDNWGQAAKLTGDSVSASLFESAIAIEGDLLAVGASRGGGNGEVIIFERDRGGPGAWGRVTVISDSATGDGVGHPLELFGAAVALEGDLLLVGAPAADVSYFGEDDGAAYVFRRNAADRDRWNFVARLTAAEATLCPGGRTLAEVLLESPEVQQEVQRCAQEDGKTDDDSFGGRVAIDGDTVVVGAAGAEAASGPAVGAAYVFRRDPAGADRWDQVAKPTGSDILASTLPVFGSALVLADDTLLVGASGVEVGSKPNQGAAYLFERHAGGPDAWGEVGKLVAGDGLGWELFGSSVAFDGVKGIVGARDYDVGQGAVYLALEPSVPAFAPTGELADGGVVEGPAGVLLGAPVGALAAPLPVWVHEVTAPAEPLSTLATPLSPFYSVGAIATTRGRRDAPFALAFPVPAGADMAHLAMAMLVPAGSVFGDFDLHTFWTPISGIYDSESNLFNVALYALPIEGSVVVLMQHPHVAPIPLQPVAVPSVPDVLIFEVNCYDFPGPEFCGPDDIQYFKDHLRRAYDKFVSLGFEQPALRQKSVQIKTLGTDPGKQVVVSDVAFSESYIKPPNGNTCFTRAWYTPDAQQIGFCYSKPRRALPDTITHEMFHAFQLGGPLFGGETDTPAYADYRKECGAGRAMESCGEVLWIIEGTASASEVSDETMRRGEDLDLYPIHQSLLSPVGDSAFTMKLPYQAQDFWVYFANRKEEKLGLGYLKSLFTLGASGDAAAEFFKRDHQTSLGVEYWNWVKNQAMEKTVKLEGLENPCHIQSSVIGTPKPPLDYPGHDPEFPNFATVKGTLSRLTAEVVRIEIKGDVGRTKIAAVQPEGSLAYKVYVEGDADCAKVDPAHPERDRPFVSLAAGSILYVVLANTDHLPEDRIEYRLEIKPDPLP